MYEEYRGWVDGGLGAGAKGDGSSADEKRSEDEVEYVDGEFE